MAADPYELPHFKREVDDSWRQEAHCRDTDTAAFYGAAKNVATDLCAECSVTWECFAFAATNDIGFGVWGGLETSQRRSLLRSHAWALTPRVREAHARAMTSLRCNSKRRRK